jgi:hypothetical protein
MKTRDEMTYEFMLALAGNSEVYKDWEIYSEKLGAYADHINNLAMELANEYLRSMG